MAYFKPTVVHFTQDESVETGKKVFKFYVRWLCFKWCQVGRWKKSFPNLPECQGEFSEEARLSNG